MPELGISYLKSALGRGAMARRALALQTSSRSGPPAAFAPSNEITLCVVKFSEPPARKKWTADRN